VVPALGLCGGIRAHPGLVAFGYMVALTTGRSGEWWWQQVCIFMQGEQNFVEQRKGAFLKKIFRSAEFE